MYLLVFAWVVRMYLFAPLQVIRVASGVFYVYLKQEKIICPQGYRGMRKGAGRKVEEAGELTFSYFNLA